MEFPHDTLFHLRCGEAYITQSPNLIGDPPSNYTHILFTGTINQALQFRLQKTLRNNRDEKTILVEHRTGYAVSIYDQHAYLSSDLSAAMPISVQATSENGVHGYELRHESFGRFLLTYAIDRDGNTLLGRYVRVRAPSPPYLGTVWDLEEPRIETFAEYKPPKLEVEQSPACSESKSLKKSTKMVLLFLLMLVFLWIVMKVVLSRKCNLKQK